MSCALMSVPARAETPVEVLHHFSALAPAEGVAFGLTEHTNGWFYGVGQGVETNRYGAVVRLRASGEFSFVHRFNDTDGNIPSSSLFLAADGSFYGTTFFGGFDGNGVVYRITPEGEFSALATFVEPRRLGVFPYGGVAQDDAGNFYGTTTAGAEDGQGAIFQLTPGGELNVIAPFGRSTANLASAIGLVYAGAGSFYGSTTLGGLGGLGTVFALASNHTVQVVIHFDSTMGNAPHRPVVGSDGNLYGSTLLGGPADRCVIYKFSTSRGFERLYSFTGPYGLHPSQLIEGSDGNLYGTTQRGGSANLGSIFQITKDGKFSALASLDEARGGTPSRLTLGRDGGLYGTASTGGAGGKGTFFRLSQPPAIVGVSKSAGGLTVNWTSVTGGLYRVERNSTLATNGWTAATGDLRATSQRTTAIVEAPGQSALYLRIVRAK